MLLNIIHPYTYKVNEETVEIGPRKEFEERDRKVASFVSRVLDSNNKVLLHRNYDGSFADYLMKEASLILDPIYEILSDPRIDCVTTCSKGVPLKDDKPKSVSDEEWAHIGEILSKHSELEQKMDDDGPIVFIGGVLERCVSNATHYYNEYIRSNQRVIYIPELCVSNNGDECMTCGEEVISGKVAHPIWDSPIPMSGSGSCKNEEVPYCPKCEDEPNFHGSPIEIGPKYR